MAEATEKGVTLVCKNCGKKINNLDKNMILRLKDYDICFECLEKAYLNNRDIAARHKQEVSIRKKGKLTPSAIKEHLDQHIIGQEAAKTAISLAVYNHYKRISLNAKNKDKKDAVEIQKACQIVAGRTGSGKTECFRAVSKFLKVPFTIVNTSSMSRTGSI